MLMIRCVVLSALFLGGASISANENLQLFACDSCNVQGMQQIAALQAPLLQCEGEINPDTGVVDIDYWENNATCYAPIKELFVVNPVTRTAYKFRVKGYNPTAGESGYVLSLQMNVDEQEIVETYYDLYNSFSNSVAALNLPATSYSVSPAAIESMCENDKRASYSNTSSAGGNETCLNSAAAHLYSSAENRNRILDEIRSEIKSQVNNQTWRDFTSSLLVTGIHSSGGLTITAGVTTGVAGSTSVSVEQQYLQNTLVVTPVGVRSCSWWQIWCKEGDVNNQIHYRVTYHGNVATRGVSALQLDFELLTSISRIEGWTITDMLGLGSRDITSDPNSCLAQFIDALAPGHAGYVNEGPLGVPNSYDFGNGQFNFCEQTKTVRACTNKGAGSDFVCYNIVFITLTMCQN